VFQHVFGQYADESQRPLGHHEGQRSEEEEARLAREDVMLEVEFLASEHTGCDDIENDEKKKPNKKASNKQTNKRRTSKQATNKTNERTNERTN
jgi:hypothetical protein